MIVTKTPRRAARTGVHSTPAMARSRAHGVASFADICSMVLRQQQREIAKVKRRYLSGCCEPCRHVEPVSSHLCDRPAPPPPPIVILPGMFPVHGRAQNDPQVNTSGRPPRVFGDGSERVLGTCHKNLGEGTWRCTVIQVSSSSQLFSTYVHVYCTPWLRCCCCCWVCFFFFFFGGGGVVRAYRSYKYTASPNPSYQSQRGLVPGAISKYDLE